MPNPNPNGTAGRYQRLLACLRACLLVSLPACLYVLAAFLPSACVFAMFCLLLVLMSSCQAVSAAASHTCGITSTAQMLCWGSNTEFQSSIAHPDGFTQAASSGSCSCEGLGSCWRRSWSSQCGQGCVQELCAAAGGSVAAIDVGACGSITICEVADSEWQVPLPRIHLSIVIARELLSSC